MSCISKTLTYSFQALGGSTLYAQYLTHFLRHGSRHFPQHLTVLEPRQQPDREEGLPPLLHVGLDEEATPIKQPHDGIPVVLEHGRAALLVVDLVQSLDQLWTLPVAALVQSGVPHPKGEAVVALSATSEAIEKENVLTSNNIHSFCVSSKGPLAFLEWVI